MRPQKAESSKQKGTRRITKTSNYLIPRICNTITIVFIILYTETDYLQSPALGHIPTI
jgi:hypothetical protein